jgi:hypothetical protein
MIYPSEVFYTSDISMDNNMTPEQQKHINDIFRMGGGSYLELRLLDDGTIVGIGPLIFTTAIYIDMDVYGWGRRYCFDSHAKAVEQYRLLQTGDDAPVGFIASRPEVVVEG